MRSAYFCDGFTFFLEFLLQDWSFGVLEFCWPLAGWFVVFLGWAQFNKYFVVWGNHPEVKNAFSQDYTVIGNYLNSLPPERQKIVIANRGGVPVPWPDGIPMSAQSIMFFENAKYGEIKSTYVLPQDLEKIKIKIPATIIPLQYDETLFQRFKVLFPQGYSQENNGILTYQIQ